MNKIIIKLTVVASLMATSILKAQNFQGQAYYESKTSLSDNFKIEGSGINDEMKKQMEEQMRKSLEKTYVLTFNKFESIFEEEKKLESPNANSSGVMIKMENSDEGKTYKNIKKKVLVRETEFFGKEFLITDSLQNYQWKIEETSKKIGDYTCYKATFIVPVSEKERKDYEEFKSKQSDGKTQLFLMDEPKEKLITVWYTPEIPISNGPSNYWGLPGLILEVNFDRMTILCSKIIINPKEKVVIKEPKNGKKVTNEEYERLIEKQMELMNNQKPREGEFSIQIRG
jgi:GLPGLI family protein